MVTKADIATGMRTLGVEAGMGLMVHSSLRSRGMGLLTGPGINLVKGRT